MSSGKKEKQVLIYRRHFLEIDTHVEFNGESEWRPRLSLGGKGQGLLGINNLDFLDGCLLCGGGRT